MSKMFWKSLRVSPTILGIILGVADNAFGDKVTASDRSNPYLQQNIQTQEPNTENQTILNSQQSQLDLTLIAINRLIAAEAIATEMELNLRQILGSDIQANSVSQPSHHLVRLEPLTNQQNLTKIPHSLKASDLYLDTSSVSFNSRDYVFELLPENQISQFITQQPEQSESRPDKSQYNLFNPTPRNLWREFSTDRPDKTETPFTVDAGRVTMEADLFIYTKDNNSPDRTRTESFNYFVPNFKVGLLNNIDLQIIPEVYNVVRVTPRGGRTEERSGFGDLTVRMKINFWGNDGGQTAFGMMPFIKFPTNQNNLANNSVEGGIIFPLAIGLSEKWDVGMQTEFDFNKNEDDLGYNLGFVNTVSFGYQIDSRLSSYFELFTEITTETDSQFVATFDTGLKYLLTENVQLDAGVNIGLTEAADDIQPFVGLSVRF